MAVLIDDRVGSKELLSTPPLADISDLVRLDSADAAFLGNGPEGSVLVGVELKSLADLVSSLKTGRLRARQVPQMLDHYDYSWLLWYGEARPARRGGSVQVRRGSGWRKFGVGRNGADYSWLAQSLLTIEMAGVRVAHAVDKHAAAEWIAVAYKWWTRAWESHKSLKVLDSRREKSLLPGALTAEERLRANVASQLPGVQYKRGVAAAKHFGSVREMVEASEEEWGEVPGIGKVVARAVVEAVR